MTEAAGASLMENDRVRVARFDLQPRGETDGHWPLYDHVITRGDAPMKFFDVELK